MKFDISKVDLKLLKSQKNDLVDIINDLSYDNIIDRKRIDSLDGIINLLDKIIRLKLTKQKEIKNNGN